MAEIKGFIFDLGRVLVGIDSEAGLPGWITRNTNLNLDQLIKEDFFTSFNKGEISPEDFWRIGCRKISANFTFEEFKELWCGFFFPHEKMQAIVNKVAAKYRIGLLSDTDPLHWAQVKKQFPWIAQTFSDPTLSYEIGYCKPDTKCFETATSKLSLLPKNCAFIDDLPQNIAGASNLGLTAIQFFSAEKLLTQLEALNITL